MAIGTITFAWHCLTVSGDIFPHGDVRQPAGIPSSLAQKKICHCKAVYEQRHGYCRGRFTSTSPGTVFNWILNPMSAVHRSMDTCPRLCGSISIIVLCTQIVPVVRRALKYAAIHVKARSKWRLPSPSALAFLTMFVTPGPRGADASLLVGMSYQRHVLLCHNSSDFKLEFNMLPSLQPELSCESPQLRCNSGADLGVLSGQSFKRAVIPYLSVEVLLIAFQQHPQFTILSIFPSVQGCHRVPNF